MLSHCLRLPFVIALASLCPGAIPSHAESAPGTQAPPRAAIRDLGTGTVKLDGLWQFHLGDDIAWANPAFDDSTGHDGWEQITADKPWGEQGHPNNGGYGW